jgi:hypothetical protein
MPLQTIKFKPGVNREGTTLANEGGWFESDKVRFRSGYPEKIGGWQKDSGTASATLQPPEGSYWGVARSLYNWVNLSGSNLLGIGTNLKYYIQNTVGGDFNDITPLKETTSAGDVTFTATDGSNVITVDDTGSNTQVGDFVTFSDAVTLSGGLSTGTIAGTSTGGATFTAVAQSSTSGDGYGAEFTITSDGAGAYTLDAITNAGNAYAVSDTVVIAGADLGGSTPANNATITVTAVSSGTITAAVLNAEHRVVTVNSSAQYTIVVGVNANANDTGDGGADTIGEYQISIGSDVFTVGVGWGAGGWSGITTGSSDTGWGAGAPAGLGFGIQLRTWSQAAYGQDLIVNPRGDGLYYWENNANPTIFDRAVLLNSASPSPFDTDVDCPEVCNFVLVSDSSRFVLAFGVNDYGSSDLDPLLVRWSDQENYAVWTPAITNQAGSFRLSAGSEIVCAQQTRQEILVFTDTAVYSMQYQGPPFVWGFQPLGSNSSIAGPNAVVTVHDITYWMGVDKFYVYNGRVQTLPCELRQFVFDDINLSQQFQIFAGINDAFSEVWWYYCSANSDTIDKYVVYNYLENNWYYGNLARTAWVDTPLRNVPVAAGYGGQILYHETGNDDGSVNPPAPIECFIQSSDFDIGEGHNFGFVWRIIPDLTFDGSTTPAPSVDFSVRPRQFPGSPYGATNNPAVTSNNNYNTQRTYNVQQFTPQVNVRLRGRQMAMRVGSTGLGVAWQLGAPRIDIRPDGKK